MSDYLCNLIIPGAAKSGTSSLHEYLGAHPMISMSSKKEPHHFCLDNRYDEGAKVHNALFEKKPNAQYFGESSTGYLPWRKAAERIVRDLDSPQVIMILRHPVARCFSHYRWRYRLGLEKRSFLEAIQRDGFGYDPEKPTKHGYMAYLEFSQYSRHCTAWQDLFGQNNCLFISSEDMLRDQQSTLDCCFEFLGLPSFRAVGRSDKLRETASLARSPSKTVTKLVF